MASHIAKNQYENNGVLHVICQKLPFGNDAYDMSYSIISIWYEMCDMAEIVIWYVIWQQFPYDMWHGNCCHTTIIIYDMSYSKEVISYAMAYGNNWYTTMMPYDISYGNCCHMTMIPYGIHYCRCCYIIMIQCEISYGRILYKTFIWEIFRMYIIWY